ncbi:852_t:CDS:2 [Funneliformis geosporum]|uniref:16131_t:CDS:1 n=1 Tax=Funneliformis geosporum TaxID=1117311 RepID=A0A9W4SLB7_9GLOM|nr:852_t:CDS:2 [Funneliformis geosporum]CAI2173284.1 16131_t:CDS:2 [Funneliformis geosporum]
MSLHMVPSACLPRLKREIVELNNEPLKGIKVKIHDDDITSMCLILTSYQGPFSNLRLHCKVKVPAEYPQKAPKITIQTPVIHPNVFSNGMICADILQTYTVMRDSRNYNGGYTPGYLLKYVFLQLLSFFSDNNVEQEDGYVEKIQCQDIGFREHSEQIVKAYQCKLCGFNDREAVKPLIAVLTNKELQEEIDVMDAGGSSILNASHNVARPRIVSKNASENASTCTVNDLNDDVWFHIIGFLPDRDIMILSSVYPRVRRLVQFYNILTRRQLVCYYLRKPFTECILGVGVRVGRGPINRRELGLSEFDLFSYEAFKDHNLRQGIWGDHFTNFLPVALNKYHFKRSLPIIQSTLMELREERGKPWNPSVILKTIPGLMNTMVVALMNACDERSARSKVLKASEKALQGYCLLLHLLLKLSKIFPQIITEAEKKINAFMHPDRKNRHKTSTPNLGEFMIYLFLAKNISWSRFVACFLEELLSRNVVWYLNSAPELSFLEKSNYVSKYRLEKTFNLSGISLRLVMFQVAFLKMMRGKEVEMDRKYGYPSDEMSVSLLSLIKEIYAAKTWNIFFNMINFPLPKTNWESKVSVMLINAVKDSEKSGYHQNPYTIDELLHLRKKKESTVPTPDNHISNDEIEKYGVT